MKAQTLGHLHGSVVLAMQKCEGARELTISFDSIFNWDIEDAHSGCTVNNKLQHDVSDTAVEIGD